MVGLKFVFNGTENDEIEALKSDYGRIEMKLITM